MLGALLAAAFYKLIKVLEYETANPSPDYEGSASGPFSRTVAGDRDGEDG